MLLFVLFVPPPPPLPGIAAFVFEAAAASRSLFLSPLSTILFIPGHNKYPFSLGISVGIGTVVINKLYSLIRLAGTCIASSRLEHEVCCNRIGRCRWASRITAKASSQQHLVGSFFGKTNTAESELGVSVSSWGIEEDGLIGHEAVLSVMKCILSLWSCVGSQYPSLPDSVGCFLVETLKSFEPFKWFGVL